MKKPIALVRTVDLNNDYCNISFLCSDRKFMVDDTFYIQDWSKLGLFRVDSVYDNGERRLYYAISSDKIYPNEFPLVFKADPMPTHDDIKKPEDDPEINPLMKGKLFFVTFETTKGKHDRMMYIKDNTTRKENFLQWVEEKRREIEKEYTTQATVINCKII